MANEDEWGSLTELLAAAAKTPTTPENIEARRGRLHELDEAASGLVFNLGMARRGKTPGGFDAHLESAILKASKVFNGLVDVRMGKT